MSSRPYTDGTGLLENLFGAAFIGFMLLARPFLKGWMAHWGATDEEASRRLPGDGRVPNPLVLSTRAVTVHAPVAAIWPWIVQIGQERGGLYSYERLENLARCQMRNANRVAPEWALQVGDRVRLGPQGYPVHRVVQLEPDSYLVLAGADPKTEAVAEIADPPPASYSNYVWSIVLEPLDEQNTRLIFRNRLDYCPRSFGWWLMWEALTEPIGFVMMRKMLLGIKARAEATQA
ncbi:MAG: hypothetical protein HZC41_10015 [Chloroflexi bacterium]|nr:hypothetical protein [Chloroflexota bacterium]